MGKMDLKDKGEIYSEAICEYLSKKGFQTKKEEKTQYIRINVSDVKDITNVDV